MRGARAIVAAGAGCLVLAGAATYVARTSSAMEAPRAPSVARIEAPPVCPWRDPEGDLRRFYPGAAGYRHERLSLAAHLIHISEQLGRRAAAAEASLDRYQVEPGGRGRVLVRRLRGEHGAIEIVVAVDSAGKVLGARVQRDREPPAVARFLDSAAWSARFQGRSGADCPSPAMAVREAPAEAYASATAVADGIRTLLVLDGHSGDAPATHTH